MSKDFCSKPCKNCPYRRDVKPFLTPERGEELAYIAQNKYHSFHCHETTESVEDDFGSDRVATSHSKMCAGFLSLQHNENGETYFDDEGFKPSALVYFESYDMAEAYENQ
jgi:hypothetical protein